MRREKFDNLVPETPEDFHVSVLDALNRMESVRLRRLRRRRKMMYIAASVVAVLALSATLFAALNTRPVREDAVVAPQEAPETPRAAEDASFSLNEYREDGECFLLDWTMESTCAEPILYEYEVRIMKGGRCYTDTAEPQYLDVSKLPNDMALLGDVVLGHEISRSMRQELWLNHFIWENGYEGQVEEVLVTVNFYRPTAEFIEDPAQKFENEPHWMLQTVENGLEAKPVNRSGDTEDQMSCSETSMTILTDYENYLRNYPAQGAAEAWEQMREYAELKQTALKMYGYADWIKGYEVSIDLTAENTTAEIREVLP